MSGRYPKAKNLEDFWENLRDGVESISFFTDEELAALEVTPELLQNPQYVKAAPILDDIDLFDASFFGYSPREAEMLDPQIRIFLECAWEALETAGYSPQTYKGAIGVYASQAQSMYLLRNLYASLDFHESTLFGNIKTLIANGSDFLPTRVSYKFNLNRPSINVQTGCSSSLVAIHLARQSLLAGECDIASYLGNIYRNSPNKRLYL